MSEALRRCDWLTAILASGTAGGPLGLRQGTDRHREQAASDIHRRVTTV